MLHEARADLCMLLGAIYLLCVGGAAWSVDAALERILRAPSSVPPGAEDI